MVAEANVTWVDDQRGILEPEQARRHFTLTRAQPAADLAHLIERHWMVEWDLTEPFTQEIVTHPSVNIAFQDPPTIHGVVTGRFRRELTGRGRVIATKFRPGGFHAFHAVPAITLTDQVILADTVFDHLRPTTFAEIEHGLRRHGWTDDPRIAEIDALYAAMLEHPEHHPRRAPVHPRRLLQAHAPAPVPRVRRRHAQVGARPHPPP